MKNNNIKYVEPESYFTKEMLEAAEEYDRMKELERAAEESNKAARENNLVRGD